MLECEGEGKRRTEAIKALCQTDIASRESTGSPYVAVDYAEFEDRLEECGSYTPRYDLSGTCLAFEEKRGDAGLRPLVQILLLY